MKTTARTRFSPARIRFLCRSFPPTFDFDRNVLEDAFRQHPKAIIVCNPSNPCGKVFTKRRADGDSLAVCADKYDAYMITDEVYEHIVFAPYHHVVAAALAAGNRRAASSACSSLSKTLFHHGLASRLS